MSGRAALSLKQLLKPKLIEGDRTPGSALGSLMPERTGLVARVLLMEGAVMPVDLDELLQILARREGRAALPVTDRALRHSEHGRDLSLRQTGLLAQRECQQTEAVIFELIPTVIAHGVVLPNRCPSILLAVSSCGQSAAGAFP